MERLSLDGSPVDEEGLRCISNLPQLQVLDLSETSVTATELKLLRALPHLYDLTLSQCENLDLMELPEVLKSFPSILHVGLYNVSTTTRQWLINEMPNINFIFNLDEDFIDE